MKKTNYLKTIISILETLKKEYPSHSIGRHISLALSDYPDLFTLSDKEMLFAFEKYQAELALDLQTLAPEDYVRNIERDAEHLFDRQSEDDWEEEEI